ncbi:flagellar biosynthetic protein FliR, partial [Vibrio parahaemolyticus V-223/04]
WRVGLALCSKPL